jgi:hypothetical protein
MLNSVDPGRIKGIGLVEAWRPRDIALKFAWEKEAARAGYSPIEADRIARDLLARRGIKPLFRRMSINSLTRDNGAHVIGQLISGNGGTAFNNANARICVGTSSTANPVPNTSTALTAEVCIAMDPTYPSVGAPGVGSNIVTWRSTFASGDANQAWNEWGIRNAAAGAGDLLNRAVQAFGTKIVGVVWQITATITFS